MRKNSYKLYIISLIILIFVYFLSYKIFSEFKLKNIEKSVFENVTGVIGGVPVSIPQKYAHFLEFNGGHNFFDNKKNMEMPKTDKKPIRSFGFRVSRNEMAKLSLVDKFLPEKKSDQKASILIGVAAGEQYSGDNFAEVMAHTAGERFEHYYEISSDSENDLEHYIPVDVDAKKRIENKHPNFNDKDIYLHKNDNGKIDTYIECNNNNSDSAPCVMEFSMSPDLQAAISINFSRFDIPYWLQMRKTVTNLIFGFKVAPPSRQFTP